MSSPLDASSVPDTELLSREAAIRSSKMHNTGYREGLFEGKATATQEGFDLGYRLHCRAEILFAYAAEVLESPQVDETRRHRLQTLLPHSRLELQRPLDAPAVLAISACLDRVLGQLYAVDPAEGHIIYPGCFPPLLEGVLETLLNAHRPAPHYAPSGQARATGC